jgi:putative nucleotidyltransferase with HDIG domain
MVADMQARTRRQLRLQAENAADSPTLKAAVDTWMAERRTAGPDVRRQLHNTIAGELARMSGRVDADALIITDTRQRTLASSGRLGVEWPVDSVVPVVGDPATPEVDDGVIHSEHGHFIVVAAPLVVGEDTLVGTLYLASSLDDVFAMRLGELAQTPTAIVSRGTVTGSTLSEPLRAAFTAALPQLAPGDDAVVLQGESYAVRRLLDVGDTTLYALSSIDESARLAVSQMTTTLAFIAIGALALALLGSIWIAHTLSRPIGRLSTAIDGIATTRDFESRLAPGGTSRELDALTDTFNQLMASVAAAEAETKAAYTAAIRGLAAALDARDPYTAGHSERVSALSVAIGRVMHLPADELEVLRLGALLHDIGKIGVPDDILRKPGPLTEDEYRVLQQHTVLGARILGTVPFLAPHIPIVELHHERPDGLGYPRGLRSEEIPLPARIVHVADAFDAMTSARAYRPERPVEHAVRELRQCVGTEFHADVVAALVEAISTSPAYETSPLPEALSA